MTLQHNYYDYTGGRKLCYIGGEGRLERDWIDIIDIGIDIVLAWIYTLDLYRTYL